MAEYATAEELVAAAQAARDAGYLYAEAYAPYAVEGLAEALGFRGSRIPAITLPVFSVNDMPLGLQVLGFADRDADACVQRAIVDQLECHCSHYARVLRRG